MPAARPGARASERGAGRAAPGSDVTLAPPSPGGADSRWTAALGRPAGTSFRGELSPPPAPALSRIRRERLGPRVWGARRATSGPPFPAEVRPAEVGLPLCIMGLVVPAGLAAADRRGRLSGTRGPSGATAGSEGGTGRPSVARDRRLLRRERRLPGLRARSTPGASPAPAAGPGRGPLSRSPPGAPAGTRLWSRGPAAASLSPEPGKGLAGGDGARGALGSLTGALGVTRAPRCPGRGAAWRGGRDPAPRCAPARRPPASPRRPVSRPAGRGASPGPGRPQLRDVRLQRRLDVSSRR